MGKRQKSFGCLKSKLSFGVFMPFEVSKLSITGIIKIILKEEKFKVNCGNCYFLTNVDNNNTIIFYL